MTHEPGIVLNERQRVYLLAIFKVDQELESATQSTRTKLRSGYTRALC
jgi:hypothetical protein